MAAKVHSADPPAFKKPVPMTPPLTTWDPAFLKRKAELPEQIFTLKSGRFLGYYAEGKPEDPAVLCFASAGFNVSSLIPKEPVPGAFMVYVNQMGHGGSSPLESKVVFSERVPEILELADGLKIEKFHVSGHSCGGVLASQIAAAYPERVLGLAIISSPGNMYRPEISAKERKEIDKAGAAYLDMSGCMGVLFRKMALDGSYYYADKSKDFGFTGHACGGYSYYSGAYTGGCPKIMKSDHYFVSKMLDAELNGSNSYLGMRYEMQGVWSHQGWSYDVATIKCPTFIYGEIDGEVPVTFHELTHKLIPESELVLWKAHGHASIAMESAGIFTALVQNKSFPGDYGNAEV